MIKIGQPSKTLEAIKYQDNWLAAEKWGFSNYKGSILYYIDGM